MRIADLLTHKGSHVVTIGSGATVADLVALLEEHSIGAVVVSDTEGEVAGIVSERDVVRRFADPGVRERPVAEIMTTRVVTCTPQDEVEALARAMTEHRVRHLPVLDDGRLVGVISIGDVVKHRLDELQAERDQLQDYIQSGS